MDLVIGVNEQIRDIKTRFVSGGHVQSHLKKL